MKNSFRLLFLVLTIVFTAFMIINPRETVAAASLGVNLWFSVVLPALLPFFIVAELLVTLRLVNFLGVILEPIMRPIFRLPGCSSLVLVLGFTSGFPVGAILTKKLYEDKMLTGDEAERLASFTNNSSPLFILGAVGVGMFANPAAGYLLAISHYLANLCLGFLWRFKAVKQTITYTPFTTRLQEAYKCLLRDTEESSIGKILGDAIRNSINNILAVGGFIIIFSVFTRMFAVWGLMDLAASFITQLLGVFNLSYPLSYGLCMGFFEMTLGAKTAIAAESSLMLTKLVVVSSILAFSGLSIIAQVMSILAGTPVRFSFYLLSRFLQIIMSAIITLLGYRFFFHKSIETVSIGLSPIYKALYSLNAWTFSLYCMGIGFIIILLMVLISVGRKS